MLAHMMLQLKSPLKIVYSLNMVAAQYTAAAAGMPRHDCVYRTDWTVSAETLEVKGRSQPVR